MYSWDSEQSHLCFCGVWLWSPARNLITFHSLHYTALWEKNREKPKDIQMKSQCVKDSERKRNSEAERVGENYYFVIIASFIYIFMIWNTITGRSSGSRAHTSLPIPTNKLSAINIMCCHWYTTVCVCVCWIYWAKTSWLKCSLLTEHWYKDTHKMASDSLLHSMCLWLVTMLNRYKKLKQNNGEKNNDFQNESQQL